MRRLVLDAGKVVVLRRLVEEEGVVVVLVPLSRLRLVVDAVRLPLADEAVVVRVVVRILLLGLLTRLRVPVPVPWRRVVGDRGRPEAGISRPSTPLEDDDDDKAVDGWKLRRSIEERLRL